MASRGLTGNSGRGRATHLKVMGRISMTSFKPNDAGFTFSL
jgi:hypothetical protein